MRNAVDHPLPATPPADALAELDTAARVLDEVSMRAVSLTIDMDEHARVPRIVLDDGCMARRLTPTQLFELLAG